MNPGKYFVTMTNLFDCFVFRLCQFCVKGQNYFSSKDYNLHLKKVHHEALFKCSVCQFGFIKWTDACKHLRNKHGNVKDKRVVLPSSAERLLACSCLLRKCRKKFIGINRK